MHISFGHDIEISCAAPTPFLTLLEPHPQTGPLIAEHRSLTRDTRFRDGFGNEVSRFLAPAGVSRFFYSAVIEDSGQPEPSLTDQALTPVDQLPDEVLPFLTPSRYCESDLLLQEAWGLFGAIPNGAARAKAIIDFVHQHLQFGYMHASIHSSAFSVMREPRGVCRDFAHLAIALCRATNIPARYCNGYLGDIGVPANPAPMDFNAWLEVWLEGAWHTLDARHNQPRIGRILIARGRDAADIPMLNSFGPHVLQRFHIWTEEVPAGTAPRPPEPPLPL